MSYSQRSTSNPITFGNNGTYAILAAGWETASQKALREGDLVVPVEILPHAIWIDILNQNIVRCPWFSLQTFLNPAVPPPPYQASLMVPQQPQQPTTTVPQQPQQPISMMPLQLQASTSRMGISNLVGSPAVSASTSASVATTVLRQQLTYAVLP